jgi:tetratricopeptide (TPR) repeat protein/archaellum biogenesis ATPase FlaH
MQLLEKDPEKRPGSATVVLQALESIAAGKAKEESVQKATPAENPLYRRVFVGRERELKQLQSAFDGAISGQGALVMVVGEPGIGKTAICEQLATYVTLRGGKTLWGHCYEEGSLSLPYLAFVEAMRSYVIDREPEDLKKELGSGATDVARIVSEIREKLKVEPREAQNPEEDRYRLMQAVMSFFSNAANVKPMLVILEDLHDADKGTLEMLTYISRNLTNTRLLLIGTYRDVEVDRNHPLSAALAELRRVSSFGRVLLRGLNIGEVRRMLTSITQEEVPMALAEAVHRQTEGNPLFVQEVIRYLTEQKLLIRAGGQMLTTASTPLEMNIPEGLRDVIGKRLSSLSDECNRLLSIAAVIGREFRFDVLQKVAGLHEEEILSSIEEAKRVSIIEERSVVGAAVTYRFTHAFFRTVLYEENIAPRRIRLHQQIARALEEVYASRLQEHAAELAEHFSYSSEADDLTKAVEYGEMAAQRATDVYDYGEAARLLQQAIKVQEVLDPENREKLCDLLIALGNARIYIGETNHALEVEAPEALSLAEAIGDKKRASNACLLAMFSLGWASASTAMAGHQAAEWLEIIEGYAEPGTVERAYADHLKGIRNCMRGFNEEGIPLIKKAREQAKALDDTTLLMWTSSWLLIFGTTPWSAREILQLLDEMEPVYDKGIKLNITYPVSALLACGKRKQAEDLIPIGREFAARTGWIIDIAYAMNVEAIIAYVGGKLKESIEILEDMIELAQDSEYQGTISTMVMFTGLRSLLYLGDSDEDHYRSVRKVIEENMNTPVFRYVPLYQAHQGHINEVNKLLERMLERRPNITSREDLTQAYLDIAYLESAVLAGHRKLTELLLERFKDNTLATASHHWLTCIARHLGGAAALLGRYDEARQHYKEAIKVCTEMKFRPELALTRLQLAELLLDLYPDEKAEALEHLDFAIKEFREMKMQPSLERALRRKEILKA